MSDHTVIDAEAVEVTTDLVATADATPIFSGDSPADILTQATEVANALAPVIQAQGMYHNIQGKSHVTVEGWTTLGALCAVTPFCLWTRPMENGWEARVEVHNASGRVVGSAEAECLRSEKRWGKADDYALRSMAQTRATSKALASVLRFVITLAGYAGTPAEEMTFVRDGAAASDPAPAESEFQANVLPEAMQWAGHVHAAEWKTIKSTGRSKLLVVIRVPNKNGGKDATEDVWIDPLREEFTQVCEAVGGGGLVEVGADVSAWVGRPIDFIVTVNGQYRNHRLLPGTAA